MMLGELNCLNCARHLADLRVGSDRRPFFDHPGGQETRPILVVWRGGPRCAHCGGRALLDSVVGG